MNELNQLQLEFRDKVMFEALAMGFSLQETAEIFKISKQRVYQRTNEYRVRQQLRGKEGHGKD